jgi:hypothetical protein
MSRLGRDELLLVRASQRFKRFDLPAPWTSRPPSLRYGAPSPNVCHVIELGRDVGLAESGAHPYRITAA